MTHIARFLLFSTPLLSPVGSTRAAAADEPLGVLVVAHGQRVVIVPPYSPDFNPIELCFAKLKAILRAARCRSIDTLWPLLGACLSRFSATECRNYFRHCGYAVSTAS